MFWLPVKIIYSYPLIYYVIPNFLFKARYLSFVAMIVTWGVAGWFVNFLTMAYIIFPVQRQFLGWNVSLADAWQPATYLCLLTAAAGVVIIKLFEHWIKKQQEWMDAEKEKASAQLQLLKAQLHPHFLFNTLNNIYSFALENSPKTPSMILKLSSLLSYILYDCKADEVLLEKEVEVMKNYIDLEKERYGDKIDISVNFEGDIQDKYITPLLILPFLENAFKHGTSEQIDNPWMSVDIAVRDFTLKCKVVNSKNEFVPFHENGVGINNVKKRLEFLYPGKYNLKLADEGEYFVVSFLLELKNTNALPDKHALAQKQQLEKYIHETELLVN